jgi:hypothetical protein
VRYSTPLRFFPAEDFRVAVNTTALIQLSVLMDSPTFRMLSTIAMFIMLILWIGNAVMTVKGILTGKIFGLTGGWKQSNQTLLPEKQPQGEGNRGEDHHSISVGCASTNLAQ